MQLRSVFTPLLQSGSLHKPHWSFPRSCIFQSLNDVFWSVTFRFCKFSAPVSNQNWCNCTLTQKPVKQMILKLALLYLNWNIGMAYLFRLTVVNAFCIALLGLQHRHSSRYLDSGTFLTSFCNRIIRTCFLCCVQCLLIVSVFLAVAACSNTSNCTRRFSIYTT